ncbi:uncharacterized protein LOC113316482 [Papaver somniferum]|uniref:uncharacterized protein LOC113316482 n=1 Tax=Papaver somniferum TaxID=3469 RepID=UPI000E6FD6CC|nr:uncharacterized protein LOC113316482 [Papaver somniferum]
MSNLIKLDFAPLFLNGGNYISWVLDAELHLEAKNLGHTIRNGDSMASERACAAADLRRHLSTTHKDEFMACRDPQDFKSVSDYNSALYRITAQLQLCHDTVTEESKLEKNFSMFHSSQIVLQQQYRERRFTRYSELIGVLLLAEQNNELMVKNHESRPCGSAPVIEVNETSYSGHGRDSGKRGSRGKKNKRGGRKNKNTCGNPYKKEHDTDVKQAKGKELAVNPSKKTDKDQHCFRCGRNNHWYRTCRTPDYLCELFMKNENKKAAKAEMNRVEASVSMHQISKARCF